jgi:hypothetical protein
MTKEKTLPVACTIKLTIVNDTSIVVDDTTTWSVYPGASTMKEFRNKLVFVFGKPFQPSLFVGKAGAYPRVDTLKSALLE